MIDALATRGIYAQHIAPIWRALPEQHRGTFYVGGHLVGSSLAADLGAVPKNMTLFSSSPRVLVASQLDYQQVASHRRVIHAQHGAGQSYGGDTDPAVSRAASYAGGDNQDRTDLFIVPGPHPAQRCKARYPHIPVAEVGSPALDRWLPWECQTNPAHVIALAWHWENNALCPESRMALPHFRSALADLTARYVVIGHAHPRAKATLDPAYETLGISWVNYETVMSLADVLVVDNSSIGWEFLATGRPVVWLTPPWYRDIDHGIRFGPDFASRGFLEAREPWQLVPAVEDALRGHGVVDVSHVYSHMDGRSAQRAAAAIAGLDNPADAATMLEAVRL